MIAAKVTLQSSSSSSQEVRKEIVIVWVNFEMHKH